ncbi:hypothetical protein A5675_24525 [Mycobacterium malmoense]|uniref:hypothetical protein n=1 Tax=Mycobacterium malmoense TaxID=1780 RepID=UPI00080B90F0|nr:hypothetical protein [Mycobacterium malmoense]OCB32364.1 hypothetical protein A5675_24525 [Mycobacterium malmoense]
MDDVTFRLDAAIATKIKAHLQICSRDSLPLRDSRVDLRVHSVKLRSAATTYKAWHERDLVGLIAIYRNDASTVAFINSVSSTYPPFRQSGVARDALAGGPFVQLNCDVYGPLGLEVHSRSDVSCHLYRSLDFIQV